MSEITTSENTIELDDFDKVVLKTAKILNVSEVSRSKKLLAFDLQCGDKSFKILSGIKEHYSDHGSLQGKHVVFISNLKPRSIMGETSEGMLLTVENAEGKVSLLFTPGELGDNARVL